MRYLFSVLFLLLIISAPVHAELLDDQALDNIAMGVALSSTTALEKEKNNRNDGTADGSYWGYVAGVGLAKTFDLWTTFRYKERCEETPGCKFKDISGFAVRNVWMAVAVHGAHTALIGYWGYKRKKIDDSETYILQKDGTLKLIETKSKWKWYFRIPMMVHFGAGAWNLSVYERRF